MDQGRRGGDESSDALERIYDAALEPDRFQDLLTTWQQQLEASEKAGGSGQFDHHLDRAIQIAELSLARWEAEMAKDEYDIHGDSRPAMIVSHHGKVLDANAAASAAYGIDPPMAMSELPFDGYTMEEIGARLLQGASTSILRTVRTDSGTAVAIYLMALGAGKSVLRTTDLVWSDALENVLRGAFGLTDAELAVTRLIAEGHSVADAAEMRGASITTVRAQIRAIYGKTGSESLNELVRMVMGLSGLPEFRFQESLAERGESAEVHPWARELHLFELADGRLIEYAEYGDPDGYPVLYVHDNFYNVVWPDALVRGFQTRGLRVIAPLRPLYGHSSPPQSGYGSVEACCSDLLALTEALFEGDFVIFTRTLGLRYARVLAGMAPHLVKHIVAFAPALPFTDPMDVKGMPLSHRFQAMTNRSRPKMLDFISRVVFSYFRRRGALSFYRWAYRDVPADLEVLKQPLVQRCIEATSELSTSHGSTAWLQDMQRISAMPEDREWGCPVPVTCYIGEQDGNTRWARAQRLIEQGEDVTAFQVDGAGELFFYTHVELAIDAVAKVAVG